MLLPICQRSPHLQKCLDFVPETTRDKSLSPHNPLPASDGRVRNSAVLPADCRSNQSSQRKNISAGVMTGRISSAVGDGWRPPGSRRRRHAPNLRLHNTHGAGEG